MISLYHNIPLTALQFLNIYNNKHQLLSVAQKIDASSYKTQWDRSEKLDEMLNKLALKLPKDSLVINKIREAIPDDYKTIFYPHLKIAC